MNISKGSRGGILGDSRGAGISNCYSAMDWKSAGSGIVASCIDTLGFHHVTDAHVAWNYPTVVSCLGANASGNANKFCPAKDMFATGFKGNYEYAASSGTSNASAGAVDIATEENLKDSDFYRNTLLFDPQVWDFSHVSEGALPTLIHGDPNTAPIV